MKKTDTFSFGPWKITTAKGAILKAGDVDRISAELELPSLPEMVFGDNILQIDHSAGFGIQFNAIDALKRVDNRHDLMKVAVAEEWQSKRQDSEYIKEVIKPFDWTFTTDYRGTLTGKNKMTMKVESTDERIDMEQLKVKEKIYFYEDVILFEDELADNGISKLNVKMRVMQGGFFLLLRFFMRVDGVLIRINDTRIYHKAGSSYMLREYSSKERKMEEILGLKVPITDPSELAQHLVLKNEIFERLSFPDGVDEKFGVEQSVSQG